METTTTNAEAEKEHSAVRAVWMASHIMLHRARFLLQESFPALLDVPGKLFVDSYRFTAYYQSGKNPPLSPSTPLPQQYADLHLYHVRVNRFVDEELRLRDQDIQDGDVFVIVQADDEHRTWAAEIIRKTQNFPVSIPSDLFPSYKKSASVEEVFQAMKGREASQASGIQNVVVIGGVNHMGDNYSAGQVGAMGPNAKAEGNTFNQIWSQIQGSTDLKQLAAELSQLRSAMKKEAVDPEHDIAVSEVAKAQKAAETGDGSKAMEHLKSAGKWALDVATDIGVGLAVELLKASSGLR